MVVVTRGAGPSWSVRRWVTQECRKTQLSGFQKRGLLLRLDEWLI